MTTLIKLFYAGAIAALLVLMVAFGIRTFYVAPKAPQFPGGPSRAVSLPPPTTEPAAPTPEQRALDEAQRRYSEEYAKYERERARYRRNVFLAVFLTGVAAVAGGVAVPGRLDAIRLGLVAGGLVTLLYGVVQAGDDLGRAGPAVIFLVALGGLVLVLAAGYRWLAGPAGEAT